MTRDRLSFAQEVALDLFSEQTRPMSAAALNVSIATARVLAKKGLIEHRGGSGRFATWAITPAGHDRIAYQKSLMNRVHWLG